MVTPTLGRQSSKHKGPPGRAKGNTSILSFFKKVDEPKEKDGGGMFFGQTGERSPSSRSPSPVDVEDRYNEVGGSVKRRRISEGADSEGESRKDESSATTPTTSGLETISMEIKDACSPPPPEPEVVPKPKIQRGPFLDDSDSEEEDSPPKLSVKKDSLLQKEALQAEEKEIEGLISRHDNDQVTITKPISQEDIHENNPVVPAIETIHSVQTIPRLKKEATNLEDFSGFDGIEDFQEFEEGEEFLERRWMEEQAGLELGDDAFGEDADSKGGSGPGDDLFGEGTDTKKEIQEEDTITASCPICSFNLDGISADDVSRHVNACLDGNPIPLPAKKEIPEVKSEPNLMPLGANARFSRSAIARPGQANPFSINDLAATPSSAFSKIMSSHAEDQAWASAAAAEHAARGKPAYQRTCPFYKIMPGFYICVDAFRYGAVKDCNAYFLSHFHSDHYIGLTSTWCHGPIYCSKVTANLMKQQLRVDPKWVVPLNFEERFEVPGTNGVGITMIPANHCPGSSLFLFEKIVGKGSNPKVQRVLHCGDFRACPAHLTHPLLMPDVQDSINGRWKQQKVDVCYLDTTYLNPRYAFPAQEDVIKACADMCVSLKKERAEEDDAWETVKRQRAGTGMTSFLAAAPKPADPSIAMEISPKTKARGRLLVICGTYSIGKERICMGIARALDCKIYAPPSKQRICRALEDPELAARLTEDPLEAQIHMQMLMEIRAETLQEYLNGYKPHFSRVVGFRPSGWNYKPPGSRFVESPSLSTILHSSNWKSSYSMGELIPQRGSTREASCFGVPYSEHSSFRELTMFCMALRIEKIVPTVNVGSAASRAKMKSWCDRWLAERRKNGVIKLGDKEGEVKW